MRSGLFSMEVSLHIGDDPPGTRSKSEASPARRYFAICSTSSWWHLLDHWSSWVWWPPCFQERLDSWPWPNSAQCLQVCWWRGFEVPLLMFIQLCWKKISCCFVESRTVFIPETFDTDENGKDALHHAIVIPNFWLLPSVELSLIHHEMHSHLTKMTRRVCGRRTRTIFSWPEHDKFVLQVVSFLQWFLTRFSDGSKNQLSQRKQTTWNSCSLHNALRWRSRRCFILF